MPVFGRESLFFSPRHREDNFYASHRPTRTQADIGTFAQDTANHLSEHTKRTLSRRHRGPGKFSTCASIPGVRCGESFFRHLPENKTLLCALGVSAVNTRLLILAQRFQSHFHRLVHCSGHDEQDCRKGQDNQKPLPHGDG